MQELAKYQKKTKVILCIGLFVALILAGGNYSVFGEHAVIANAIAGVYLVIFSVALLIYHIAEWTADRNKKDEVRT